MTRKFFKWPGPGEFRGDGEWVEATDERDLAFFEECKATGYLPVKEEPDEGGDENHH